MLIWVFYYYFLNPFFQLVICHYSSCLSLCKMQKMNKKMSEREWWWRNCWYGNETVVVVVLAKIAWLLNLTLLLSSLFSYFSTLLTPRNKKNRPKKNFCKRGKSLWIFMWEKSKGFTLKCYLRHNKLVSKSSFPTDWVFFHCVFIYFLVFFFNI